MSGQSFEVPPLSRDRIRSAARQLRNIRCALAGSDADEPYFPIIEFLDVELPKHLDGFVLEIWDIDSMRREYGEAHAMTYPEDQLIQVRDDIYEGAAAGQGRDRSTLAHELGHVVLHNKQGLARRIADASVPTYRQSEWQAKAFAGELLVSADHIYRCSSVLDVPDMFGVSFDAAEVQWSAFMKAGLIRNGRL